MRRKNLLAGAVAVVLLLVAALAHAAAPVAKNVIICISDGAGFNTYNAASYYQYGRIGCQPYEQPGWVKIASHTISLNQLAPKDKKDKEKDKDKDGNGMAVDPITFWDPRVDVAATLSLSAGIPFKGYALLKKEPTDSAAAATAMASGQKAYNGRLNYVPDYDQEYPLRGETIAEIAKAMGKATGVITTVQWTDATPAGLGGAHSMGRGSRRDIANEMLTSGTLDVIMGAGHPEFDDNGAPREPRGEGDYDKVGGSFTWEQLKSGTHAQGWKLVHTKAQFEALTSGPTPRRVIGVPHVPGATQQERATQDWNRDGRVDGTDMRYAPPFKDPFIPTVPSLATMTKGALNVLGRNPQGFYLMVEGGAVDHAGHSNQPGRLIEEQVDFNDSLAAIVEWVNRNSSWNETLVIVTADHETGLIWGPNSDTIAFDRMTNRGSGWMPGLYFNSGNHSNALVPLRARGPGASLFTANLAGSDPMFGDYVKNTMIFQVMRAAMSGETAVSSAKSTKSE